MKTFRLACALASLLVLAACEPATNHTAAVQQISPSEPSINQEALAERFALAFELKPYTDLSLAVQKAEALDAALSLFLYSPNAENLAKAQQAWRAAYDAFLQTLLYSKLPIATPVEWHKQGISYQQTLMLLDTWPIEGGYIDHVPGYPFSGIVNDLTLSLTTDSLLNQHNFADPSYASLGFHVLEFMLWGADGQRQVRDFSPRDNTASAVEHEADLKIGGGISVQNHHRRRQFVQLVSEQLQTHLQRLQRRWEPSNGYYAQYMRGQLTAKQNLAASLSAIKKLIKDEILAKRLHGQSSEFSDTSWADMQALTRSIQQFLTTTDLLNADDESWSVVFEPLAQCSTETLASCQENLQQLLTLLNAKADSLGVYLGN